MAKDITIAELLEVFPENIPDNLKLCDHSPDDIIAIEETNQFEGRKWIEIESDFLGDVFEVPFWFAPQAFHYYFPSFIKCSLENALEVELLLGSVVGLIGKSSNNKWENWRQDRWSLFTKDQIRLIEKWLFFLESNKDIDLDEKSLIKAEERVKELLNK